MNSIYVPTPEDVKALKDAEQNIIEDKIDDHQFPPEGEPYEEPDDGGLDLDFEAPRELDFEYPDAPLVAQPPTPQHPSKQAPACYITNTL